jgi:hypothetical protein
VGRADGVLLAVGAGLSVTTGAGEEMCGLVPVAGVWAEHPMRVAALRSAAATATVAALHA